MFELLRKKVNEALVGPCLITISLSRDALSLWKDGSDLDSYIVS